MKREKIFFMAGFISVTLVSGLLLNSIFAASAQPGSSGDPLVSKSYVDNKINEALSGGVSVTPAASTSTASGSLSSAERDAIVRDVLAQVNSGTASAPSSAPPDVMDQFSPVSIVSGQILVGYEGTEIILRSGKVTGYCEGENGLVDITDGKEIGSGADIKANHLIIVPRYESRGVKATGTAWLMVKGGYEILN